jgi:hypothetical protein
MGVMKGKIGLLILAILVGCSSKNSDDDIEPSAAKIVAGKIQNEFNYLGW